MEETQNAPPPTTVYLLHTADGGSARTYVGATYDPVRRLREHNSGGSRGARATHGRTWHAVIWVTGFATWSQCLSFESCWRRCGRHRTCRLPGRPPLARRVAALGRLLTMAPVSKWHASPRLIVRGLQPYACTALRATWPLAPDAPRARLEEADGADDGTDEAGGADEANDAE